jgi:RNA polymerase sigma-70 factor, ECF subfamily
MPAAVNPTAPPHTWVVDAQRRVHRYLRCLRCPATIADDLVQDTLVAALRQPETPPLAWLFTTSRNLWFAHLRARQRTVSLDQLQELHDRAIAELGSDGGDARVAALRECIAELPPRSRLAVQLRYRDGLSRAEVASRIGLGDAGCKSLFDRVRAALKTCVERRQA